MTRATFAKAGSVLLAVLAVGFTTVASAAATSWKVEGKALASAERAALASSTKAGVSGFTLRVGSAGNIEVHCTRLALTGGYLEGSTGGGAEAFTLSSCTVPRAEASCEVLGGEVKSTAVKATLEGTKVKLSPIVPETLMTVSIRGKSGKTCGLPSKFNVNGALVGELGHAGEEAAEHALSFTNTSGSSLAVGTEPATFTGEAGLSLAAGLRWSAS